MSTETKFTKEHEWVRLEGELGIVGITDFAQKELGDVVSIELPSAGDSYKQMDPMAIVDSIKASSDIYCPIDGEITEVNEKLQDTPELINQSPYDQGWIVKIKPSSPDQIDSLMSKEEYDKFVGEQSK